MIEGSDKVIRKTSKKFRVAWQRYVKHIKSFSCGVDSSDARAASQATSLGVRQFIVLNGNPSCGVSPYHLRNWLISLANSDESQGGTSSPIVSVTFSNTNIAALVSCNENTFHTVVAALRGDLQAVFFRCNPALESDVTVVSSNESTSDLYGLGCAVAPLRAFSVFIGPGSSGDEERRDVYFYFPHTGESPEFLSLCAAASAPVTPVVGLKHFQRESAATHLGNSVVNRVTEPRQLTVDLIDQVPGLFIVPEFLSQVEHDAILHELGVDSQEHCNIPSTQTVSSMSSSSGKRRRVEWEPLANRKVAHFNRRFYYKTNGVGKEGDEDLLNNRELPSFYHIVRDRLCLRDTSVALAVDSHPWPVSFDFICDQLTVNYYEYDSGAGVGGGAHHKERAAASGIARHVDAHSSFDDVIMSVSLASYTMMEFQRWDATAPAVNIYLPPRALLIMTGEARYSWTHGIAATRVDYVSDTIPPLVRGNRLSLTWRKGRDKEHRKVDCICPHLCDGIV